MYDLFELLLGWLMIGGGRVQKYIKSNIMTSNDDANRILSSYL